MISLITTEDRCVFFIIPTTTLLIIAKSRLFHDDILSLSLIFVYSTACLE